LAAKPSRSENNITATHTARLHGTTRFSSRHSFCLAIPSPHQQPTLLLLLHRHPPSSSYTIHHHGRESSPTSTSYKHKQKHTQSTNTTSLVLDRPPLGNRSGPPLLQPPHLTHKQSTTGLHQQPTTARRITPPYISENLYPTTLLPRLDNNNVAPHHPRRAHQRSHSVHLGRPDRLWIRVATAKASTGHHPRDLPDRREQWCVGSDDVQPVSLSATISRGFVLIRRDRGG
jgi:hypothetical protein